MAVIDTSMNMPKSCSDCENSRCIYHNKSWFINNPWTGDKKDSTSNRHSDCPLKSIDGLAYAIEQFPFTYGFASEIEREINEYCKENINGNNKES